MLMKLMVRTPPETCRREVQVSPPSVEVSASVDVIIHPLVDVKKCTSTPPSPMDDQVAPPSWVRRSEFEFSAHAWVALTAEISRTPPTSPSNCTSQAGPG